MCRTVKCIGGVGGMLLAVLVVSGFLVGSAFAQPNPGLSNGVDCTIIRTNAQSDQADPRWQDDNLDFAVNCPGVNPLGWGYDYAHTWVWLEPVTNRLYVCIDTYGNPGDADGDGGYATNRITGLCAGDLATLCGTSEGIGGQVFSPSEEVNLRIDRDCDGTTDLTFRISNDELRIDFDQFNPGNIGQLVGNRGEAWEIEPDVADGNDLSGTPECDPGARDGAIIFCIENFASFFPGNLTPQAFDWRVSGGHADDQLSEDSVAGILAEGDPSIDIVKTVSKDELCGNGDLTTFTLTVTNTGNIALDDVTVTDDLPLGLVFDGQGACEFGVVNQVGQQLTWSLGTLQSGETLTCSFDATTSGCVGTIRNNVAVLGTVNSPCVLRGAPAFDVTDSDFADVTCVNPDVEVIVDNAATCVGQTANVLVTVNNLGDDADVVVNCTVGGVPQPAVPLGTILAGGSDSFTIPVLCEEPGQVEVTCTAVATVLPGCAAEDDDTGTVTCDQATVEVDVNPDGLVLQACVGQTQGVNVPVKVTNTSGGPVSGTLTCTVGAGAPQNFPITNLDAGAMTTIDLTVVCEEPGTIPVTCEVNVALDSNPECTASDDDADNVLCEQAMVDVDINPDLLPLAACVGENVNVPVKVTNNSASAVNGTLTCGVGAGAPQNFPIFLDAGQMTTVNLTVACDEPGTVPVICSVIVALDSNPECTAIDDDADNVLCREALVDLDVNPDGTPLAICVGGSVNVPVKVTNNSASAVSGTLTCTVGAGAPQQFAITNLDAGQMVTENLTVTCDAEGTIDINCSVEVSLDVDQDCTDDDTDAAVVICGTATVDVDINPDALSLVACVGQGVNVPVKVTNTSSEAVSGTLTCTVGAGPPQQFAITNLGTGEMVTQNLTVACDTEGTIPINCDVAVTLDSNQDCAAEDNDTETVTCVQACISAELSGAEVCIGETAVLILALENCTDADEVVSVDCTVDGQPLPSFEVNVPARQTVNAPVEVLCEEAGDHVVVCTVTAALADYPECTDTEVAESTVTCLEPDVEITKSTDPEVTQSTSGVTIVVENTGTSPLNPVRVSDHIPAGLTIDAASLDSDCGVTIVDTQVMGDWTWITFSDFDLPVGGTCTITFDVECAEFDNTARIDTANVVAWCEGILDVDPDFPGVTDSDTAQVICEGGEACPHTIGFWRQQYRQRDNGSTKICLEGMYTLNRCVVNTTGLNEWKLNEGGFVSSAVVAGLGDADLFDALEAQMQGPRPMTIRDMAELQYLGLLLNVCAGALPLSTGLDGSGGFSGTVGEAIAYIEDALNNDGDISGAAGIADAINNRVGVLAADCPDGNDRFRNVEPCEPDGPIFTTTDAPASLRLQAYPNPVLNQGTVIQYAIPEGVTDSRAELMVFDVSGRLVRRLLDATVNPGEYNVSWDLRDEAGQEVSRGIYFYRLRHGAEQKTQRLLVIGN